MMMAAFVRFDPYAMLAQHQNWNRGPTPAKAAKPAKVERREAEALANLATLAAAVSETQNPAGWGEAEEERAAIAEHDGGIPRAWAEGFARLHPDRPPADVPAKRWLTFVDDVGRFLDTAFCAVALALGWGPHDLFGCDRDRPFARIDQAGLLWSLNNNRLVALSENTAAVETRTGARQTWRRKPDELGRVLPWELVDGDHQ
jgi:hypothetical protein